MLISRTRRQGLRLAKGVVKKEGGSRHASTLCAKPTLHMLFLSISFGSPTVMFVALHSNIAHYKICDDLGKCGAANKERAHYW
jgi:hypothetical protein